MEHNKEVEKPSGSVKGILHRNVKCNNRRVNIFFLFPLVSNTLAAGSKSSLPSYNEATEEHVKKKIIPVESDFESSPSPENPSSPVSSSPLYHRNRSGLLDTLKKSFTPCNNLLWSGFVCLKAASTLQETTMMRCVMYLSNAHWRT